MTAWPHWIVVPIVLPLLAAAALLLIERRSLAAARIVSFAATAALLAVAAGLMVQAASGRIDAYLLGNWQAPFGIALALDRLSALMLVLTAVVALSAVLYARAGTDERGPHFHSLFQIQLMGLNGAFLTADLFNLFVFFEVLLIASYGLLLHGAGAARLRASLHYVTFNLTGSALFLIAVATLYGVTGTLNMADLADRIEWAGPDNAALIQAAGLLLLVVFSVKAALLPLYFWLPDTYAAASAPVAALFAIMTKVGVYAIARLYTLVFGESGGVAADLAQPWLPWLAMGTLLLAAIGALAAVQLRGLIAYLVVASAGTLLLALGLGTDQTIAAALFYLVPSTLMAAALFLLANLIELRRPEAGDSLLGGAWSGPRERLGLLFFLLAISASGMPPLAGFLAKAQLLHGAAQSAWPTSTFIVVLLSSLAIVLALGRAGSSLFWRTPVRTDARAEVSRVRDAAVLLPAISLLVMPVVAGPLAAYTHAAAVQLLERRPYMDAVLHKAPAPPAWNPREGMVKP
jgi:multicomponent K+:H+ antiporter subunit D